jgi:large subunit ribosomal protein L1
MAKQKAAEETAKTAPEAPAPAPSTDAAPTATATVDSTPKARKRPGVPPRRGKKLRNTLNGQKNKVSKAGILPLKQALAMLKQLKRTKFDETIEVHIWLGIDPTQSDQLVRGALSLPNGIGKSKRVVVFCQGENVAKAKEAGADFAGSTDLVEKIQKENYMDFDVAIATQDMMAVVSRLGKVLGPRGLMPTPKAGTVLPMSGDLAGAVREFKAGKIEYRSDKSGNVHAGVGKMSFDDDKLAQNIVAFVEQIRTVKPSGVKGNYIKGITVSSTMGPGIPVTM